MTDTEKIMKGIEICSDGKSSCKGCPYYEIKSPMCLHTLHKEAADLIRRQQAEVKKQIPMKPIERIATSPVKIGNGIFGSGVKVHNCPNCNGLISPVHKCCYHCGQKLDWNTNNNTCVCCGEIIPEGRQVCPKCERG